MNVLLISTYELGRQPLGLASPLAHLRSAGIQAHGIDLAVEPLSEQAVAGADVIAISTPMHTALQLGVSAAAEVRRINPKARIVFYGHYAWLNSATLLRGAADYVLGGEIEELLVALVESLERDGPSSEIALTRSQWNGGRPRYLVPDRRDLPPLGRYARLVHGESTVLVAAVEASRGCAHRCLHCPITPVYGGRLRVIPREVVLQDVRNTIALGAQHLTFADPDFFNGVRHSMDLARSIHHEFPALTFDATIKIEHLLEHQALLPELRDLGCLFVLSAVESMSDRVLQALDKGHSAVDVIEALALCERSGIVLRPSLLPFTPWTTLDDYLRLLDFVEEQELLDRIDAVQLAIRLLVPPGSSLLGGDDLRPFVERLDEENFGYSWRHPDPRMDALAAQVAARVERGACGGEPAWATFGAVRDLARHAAGLPLLDRPSRPLQAAGPRLSESWFCCAEPTRGQRALIVERIAEVTA